MMNMKSQIIAADQIFSNWKPQRKSQKNQKIIRITRKIAKKRNNKLLAQKNIFWKLNYIQIKLILSKNLKQFLNYFFKMISSKFVKKYLSQKKLNIYVGRNMIKLIAIKIKRVNTLLNQMQRKILIYNIWMLYIQLSKFLLTKITIDFILNIVLTHVKMLNMFQKAFQKAQTLIQQQKQLLMNKLKQSGYNRSQIFFKKGVQKMY
ncbi:hypothetical protein TTHERM_001120597 (macronuclear) [Tetrahymena thermophila SB210]|uniref:Uncharacterized protein n=1 Tax=Tetrahymena thermophila (strain SB210) TaxID=312017 RepID=W7X845_TETTS|nr:hypothetical protein TTHERM_001120597 [Tetrahymena thermophila SB210]EWS73517.1 hypothetical protein TTHERM_001120597 [Tetrahymena thermophila SB210]|eukprot:XP_012653942.1 hypothetical protein TTHERM_001120597 [Tetrahymena thermophila SB210]